MSDFDKYFKGSEGKWTMAGEGVNSSIIIQTDGKGSLCSVTGTGEKSKANCKLIIHSKEMARILFNLVMTRKNKGTENLSDQEKLEMVEAERVLKLILKK